MELKSVNRTTENDVAYYAFAFQEQVDEQTIDHVTVKIPEPEALPENYAYELVETEKIKEYILKQVKTRTMYLSNKRHTKMLYAILEYLSRMMEFPMNVKQSPYPGSSLVLVEYGILGITDDYVASFVDTIHELIKYESDETTEHLEPEVAEEEEEPKADFPIEDESFPLGGPTTDFVDDDIDFELGTIEEEEGEPEDD